MSSRTGSSLQSRTPSVRLAAALILPFAALLSSLALGLGHARAPFLFFYPAVAIASWYGGIPSSVGASVLAVALADYFLIEPVRSFVLPSGEDAIIMTVFLASSVVISRLSGAHMTARASADRLAREVSERASELQRELSEGQMIGEELEAANQELAATNEELLAANELEAQRGHLFALAASLARASTPAEVASVIFHEGIAAVGADAGSVGLVLDDGSRGRVVTMLHSAGYGEDTTAAYQQFPVVAGRPLSDAVLTGAPILLASLQEWEARYASTLPAVRDLGYQAFAVVPVAIADRIVAALSFSFRAARVFDLSTVAFLETLASVSGQALERARAFEAEQRAHERTSVIVESVTDGFVALDAEFRYTYVNRRAAELWNRVPDSFLGRTPQEVFAEVDGIERSPVLATFRSVTAQRTPASIETYAPTLRRWIELRAYPSGDGGIVAFFQDITARRRAQDASSFLAEASRLLGSSTDYTDTLTNLARAAVPRLGDWCAVDVVRDPQLSQWPPTLDRVAVVHQDPAKIALGAQLTSEYPTDWTQSSGLAGVLRTGKPMYLPTITDEMVAAGAMDARHLELLRALQFRSVMVVPLVARDRVLGAVTLCMTESDRHYDESDLALAEDLARRAGAAVDTATLLRDTERANAAKTEFLRTISHELRQPINATVAFLQLWELGVRGPLSDQQRDDVARVQRNQRHLLALIEDLLSFTRLDAGKLTVSSEVVSMPEILASLDSMFARQREGSATLDIVPCDPDLGVIGDRARITQIGVNLLTNAFRATASGGRIRVECVREPGRVSLVVSDTGVGIPADQLDHIFSPFTQLGRSLNAPKEGAGLGLAISRGLAEAMAGSLTVTSAVGVGSTFVLSLTRAT
jgi:signal transduction histidine kinase